MPGWAVGLYRKLSARGRDGAGNPLAKGPAVAEPEGPVSIPHYDDLTIDRFKVAPRSSTRDFEDALPCEATAPPLWKDLTLASIVAALLWIAAAVVFA